MDKTDELLDLRLAVSRKNAALWRVLRLVDLLSDEDFEMIKPDNDIFRGWLTITRALILSELDK